MTDFRQAILNRARQKEVVGVTGTPFPNSRKEPLLVTYILDSQGTFVVQTGTFTDNVERNINARSDFDGFSVRFHKSGVSSAKPFKQQAVTVTVPVNHIPILRSEIDRIGGIIERDTEGAKITDIVFDMEGTPDEARDNIREDMF